MSTMQRECEHGGLWLSMPEGDDSTGNAWSPILTIMQRECDHDGFRMAVNDYDEFTGYSMCLLIIIMMQHECEHDGFWQKMKASG